MKEKESYHGDTKMSHFLALLAPRDISAVSEELSRWDRKQKNVKKVSGLQQSLGF